MKSLLLPLLMTISLIAGCTKPEISEATALSIAEKEIRLHILEQDLNETKIKLIEQKKISSDIPWNFIFESADRNAQFSVLIYSDGSAELHKLVQE